MGHIETARTEGAKAGFRQWKRHLERSGLEGAQDTLAELLGEGNEKAQFAFYCSKFSKKLNGVVKRDTSLDDSPDEGENEGIIAKLQARIAELRGDDAVGVQVEQTTRTRTRKAKPASTSRKRSSKRVAAPLSEGDSFLYENASGDQTEWTVVGEGTTKKHKKPALICTNGKREAAWNVKTLAAHIENERIVVL